MLWADKLIISLAEPPTELFDLSLSKNFANAISALNSLAVISNITEIVREIFKFFYVHLTSTNLGFNRISRGIYDMYFEELISSKECASEMLCYWDGLDLAESGCYGNPEEIKEAMLNLLKKYKC